MPIVVCADCNKEMSDAAPACPHCGRPNEVAVASRSVGLALGAGIFLIPLVFAWFTLRNGYSRTAKVVSFAWLAISLVLIGVQGGQENAPANSADSGAKAVEQVAQAAPATDKAVTPAIEPSSSKAKETLGVTPEEFRVSFNKFVSQIDSSYRAAEFEVQSGDVNDVFTHSFAKNVAIVGTVNKSDGSMQSLIVTIAGAGDDIAKPVIVLLSAAHALNPGVPKEEHSKAVLGLVKNAMSTIEAGTSYDETVGDLHYSAFASQYTGLMFTISSKDS
jgi:hypothetical protein